MATVLQAINEALHEAMASDENVLFLGEDILDPYGGAFKVTKGLSTSFPNRVIPTPVSEAGITGIATGLALRGMRPVIEIMFGDFLSLAFDQLLNHACKYRWMYNDQVRVPLVVRTPMGARRGYGPTHSQCVERHLMGIAGLRVVAPNSFSDPKKLLMDAILLDDDPTLFVEHKVLYLSKLKEREELPEFEIVDEPDDKVYPTTTVRIAGAPRSDLTIAAYGYMADLATEAALQIAMDEEIFAEVIVPTCLNPFDAAPILSSVESTGALLTVEEGPVALGWGSEVLSQVSEGLGKHARLATARLGAQETVIPCSRPLEDAVLPSTEDICRAAMRLVSP